MTSMTTKSFKRTEIIKILIKFLLNILIVYALFYHPQKTMWKKLVRIFIFQKIDPKDPSRIILILRGEIDFEPTFNQR